MFHPWTPVILAIVWGPKTRVRGLPYLIFPLTNDSLKAGPGGFAAESPRACSEDEHAAGASEMLWPLQVHSVEGLRARSRKPIFLEHLDSRGVGWTPPMAHFLNALSKASGRWRPGIWAHFPSTKYTPAPTLGPCILGDRETGQGLSHPHCGQPFPPRSSEGRLASPSQYFNGPPNHRRSPWLSFLEITTALTQLAVYAPGPRLSQ